MDSAIENIRKLHEERERIVDTIVKERMIERKTHKATVNSQQRVKVLVDTNSLSFHFRDTTTARPSSRSCTETRTARSGKKWRPLLLAEPLSMEFMAMQEEIENVDRAEPDLVEFTDEEGYGRFLDLHPVYLQYINLKNVKRVDYITYLGLFDNFLDISREKTKKTGAYREYLQNLKNYLTSFIQKTRPLHDLDSDLRRATDIAEKAFNLGTLAGWRDERQQMGAQQNAPVDLSAYNNAQELEGLGLERLKCALQALGLKCGGTIKERAERLFATKGHKLSQLEKNAMASKTDDAQKQKLKDVKLVCLEGEIRCMTELLANEREATKENVERKQARAVGEEEDEEEEPIIEEYEEEDDTAPYNPKNLPLGWDGKPIPYWLYKLHGLNLSFSCEICGNQNYKGPKAFQKHFTEWRHSHGMRCLGIPNTAHFANITKIKDALDLWNKMREDREKTKWDPDMDEEFEDSAGNVVTRKMYEDLKRQGLL
ncbi:hypothetical protein WR25_02602 [Diploscapter pachys]|uniref:Matrin-type domain-containing protein n=1 Tax=Diploscapter pachys TaxID=2018661 RepID=A0A2A2LAA0_9BILA|nr:hypothetical protein WR25_02602 [Diploscapter pachys]